MRPEDFGWKAQPLQTLIVKDAKESLILVRDALSGKNLPALQMVALNAGAALYAASAADSLGAGVSMAEAAVLSGQAAEKLAQLVTFSQSLADQ